LNVPKPFKFSSAVFSVASIACVGTGVTTIVGAGVFVAFNFTVGFSVGIGVGVAVGVAVALISTVLKIGILHLCDTLYMPMPQSTPIKNISIEHLTNFSMYICLWLFA
jgi:hypothetical protein